MRETTSEDLLIAANDAMRRGDLPDAIRLTRQALAKDPSDQTVLTILGGLERKQGNFSEAREVGAALLRLGVKATAYALLGQCDLDEGLAKSAEANFQEAIRLEPQNPVLHNNLGLALENLGQSKEALEAFSRAIALDPKAIPTRISKAHLLLKMGRRPEAILEFKQTAASDSNRARGLAQLAKANLIEEDPVSAIENGRKSLAVDPRYAPAKRTIASALQQMGEFQQAREIYEELIRENPSDVRAYFEYVQSGSVTKNLEGLARLMETEKDPKNRMLIAYALGKSADDREEFNKARAYFEEANDLAQQQIGHPFSPEAFEASVNKTINLFNKTFIESHTEYGSKEANPVLVVGMIRSGTTLLEKLLSRHPSLKAGGEIPFWAENSSRFFDANGQLIPPEKAKEINDEYVALLTEKPTERVIDKMPLNYAALGLIHLMNPRAKFIHISRSPRDTAVSIFVTPHPEPINWAHSQEKIVFFYRQHELLMSHWREVIPPENLLEVTYEDLVTNEGEIDRVLTFLGLDPTQLKQKGNAQNVVATPSKWQARQPVHTRSIGRWKNYEGWFEELAP